MRTVGNQIKTWGGQTRRREAEGALEAHPESALKYAVLLGAKSELEE